MWGIVVRVILSIDVSVVTATRNPLHHPSHHYYEETYKSVHDLHLQTLRGGSTILQPPPPPVDQQHEQQQQPYRAMLEQRPSHYPQQQRNPQVEINNFNNNTPTAFLPKLGLEQVTKALLHTSEWNRRFQRGIRHWGKRERINIASSSQKVPNSKNQYKQQQLHQQQHQYQNYGSLPVNVHPSRTWQPPIGQDSGRSLEEEELTLFHAKAKLCARSWGPDLLPYLKHISEVLQIENNLELVLAMVYLDRACSVETPRSNGIAHVPFLQPRTVHRLGLAALVVAKTATSGTQTKIQELSESLGIPKAQLEQMVEWMVGALGDEGLYVGLEDLKAWSKTWKSFAP